MQSCDYCGSMVIFGAYRKGEERFCNATCADRSVLLASAAPIPPEALAAEVSAVHRGRCPRCHGPGPVDVLTSYQIWSVVLLTRWQSIPDICCGSCGFKAALWNTLFSATLGWWGVPWGLIMTPVQVTRNLIALTRNPHPYEPSPALRRAVGRMMATQAAREHVTAVPPWQRMTGT